MPNRVVKAHLEYGSSTISIPLGRRSPYPLELTQHDVSMWGLSPQLEHFKIAHLTDLHAGFAGLESVYEAAIEQVNAANVDLVLLTGDYVDDSVKSGEYPIQELLARLKSRLGTFGSLGNHDHRRGAARTRGMLEEIGIRVLVNENVEVTDGLWLAGVDDMFCGDPDLDRAMAGVPKDRTSILLSHEPPMIERVGDRDVVILSGHTHGAQFVLPFPTPEMVCWVHLRCRQVAGWYRNESARLYVSRGVGVTGFPFRFHCPAEIPFYHLKAGGESRILDVQKVEASRG